MRFRFFILPFIVLLTVAAAISWFYRPTYGIWIMFILLIGYLWSAWWLDPERSDWWRFAITPWLLSLALLLFCLLVSGGWLVFVFITLLVLLQAVYWRYVLVYTDSAASYTPFSLERLSFIINFLVVFLLASAMYGFKTFLDISTWILLPIFGVCLAILISQRLWISKATGGVAWRLAGSLFIGTIQIFLLTSFLPLDFRLLGFLVAAAYYGFISLGSEVTDNTVNRRNVWILITILTLASLAVFLTARWY